MASEVQVGYQKLVSWFQNFGFDEHYDQGSNSVIPAKYIKYGGSFQDSGSKSNFYLPQMLYEKSVIFFID
jgi:hypothetical protein